MTDERQPLTSQDQPTASQVPVREKPPEPDRTIDFAPDDSSPAAGTHSVIGDSGPPLPTGGSVLQALAASTHGVLPQIHLREPDDEPLTTMDQPRSEHMPDVHQLPERYQVAGEIGRGGMGAILKGRDVELGRDIAVKIMLECHAGRTELFQRFVEEAQIAGQLQHPGIVPVYDIGRFGDRQPYFTMKLIKGRTLADLLKEHGSKIDKGEPKTGNPQCSILNPRFLSIFESICQTMAYAHARGVIHRDLKPANIMVGNFGEVQVMDWGLAKVLDQGSGGEKQQSPLTEASVIRTARSQGISDAGESAEVRSGSQTQAGTVLGTPAYMSPEQARGEIDSLDERCDVFGLGAILCAILTGKPPYEGKDASTIHKKAMQADLENVWERLDNCGADAALITLVKHCLQPLKSNRPRNAGEAARAVTDYMESVQARLKQAEVERAAAQARAEEEQKRRQAEQAKARAERQRRQVSVALAGLAVLFVVAAAAAGLWYQHDLAEREAAELRQQNELAEEKANSQAEETRRQTELAVQQQYLAKEVSAALIEVKNLRQALQKKLAEPKLIPALLSNLDEWQKLLNGAQAAVQRAVSLAGSSKEPLPGKLGAELEMLQKQVQADQQDFEVAKKLDSIRLEAAALIGGQLNTAMAGPKYAKVFGSLGLNPAESEPAEIATKIKQAPLCYVLVAALDHWAQVTPLESALLDKLLAVSREADPDPWRDQVRDPKNWRDGAKLEKLAGPADLSGQSPQIIMLLASRLEQVSGPAVLLLRKALVHHPSDFWLHFQLAAILTDPAEQVGFYHAALAVRPSSSMAYNNLGVALYDKKDLDQAAACFQKALELDSGNSLAHHNQGIILYDQKKPEAALQCFKKAVAFNKDFAQAHNSLGLVLHDKKELEGAIEHYQMAIQLNPKSAKAHNNLGNALADIGNREGAIKHYRIAIALNPKGTKAHFNLGCVLADRKDLDGAIACFLEAIAVNPKDALAHSHLGNVLIGKGNLKGAITAYQNAINADPNYATAHYNLGVALYENKELSGAIKHLKKAIDIHPNYALAHNQLGMALAGRNDLDGAIAFFQKAIALNPNDAKPHFNLGLAKGNKGDWEDAVASLHEATKLNHNYANAYAALGYSLLMQGQFDKARQATLQCLQLLPANHPSKNPMQQQLQQCEKMLALDQMLPAILKGQMQPKNVAEQVELAELCYLKKLTAAAVRFYQEAFQKEPLLAGKHGHNAACAAALAAAGKGQDANKFDEKEKAKLRQQALNWLKANLIALGQLAATNPQAAAQIGKDLPHWQKNPALAGVRDAQELAKLPEGERQTWQLFWADVDKLIQQVSK